TGDNINKAVKNLSRTAVANIELDHDDNEGKPKIKTIKEISKLFYWKWPVYDRYNSNSKFLKLKDIVSIGQNERDEKENEMNSNPIVVISIP
ncbi:21791_t:CDS:2, partial [Gigaspora rosea]